MLLLCRGFLHFFPLPLGPIISGSRGEFAYCVYMIVTILVMPPLHGSLVPFPLRALFYSLLGAEIGSGTAISGMVMDPPLVRIGSRVNIGMESLLISHGFERDSYMLGLIVVGNDVTIGARAVVMAGVIVGDGATVAAGAVVTKNTHIGPGEVWGGVPARLLRQSPDVPPAI
jgi:acetyltransferase-like isoleucine patch superfamily enzyme